MNQFNPKITLLLLLMAISAQAQTIPDDVKSSAVALRDQAMRDTIAYELVESLTMEVGPRSAGSAGDAAAVAWAVEMMQGLGFQNVRKEEVLVPHWERGSISAEITAPFPQRLVATSLGGSPATPEAGIHAEVVRVESLNELRALTHDDLSGKIAFVDHVMERAKDSGGYSAASRIRKCGHYVAAERGALATIIRSAGTSVHRVPHTGNMLNRPIPAEIPAAAPQPTNTFLLSEDILKSCPTAEPIAEPICTIGPSRPADPPEPIQIADARVFTTATRGRIMAPRRATAFITSGTPCPLASRANFIIKGATKSPPMAGIIGTQ